MSAKRQLYGAIKWALNVDHVQFDRLFALVLLAFVGGLLAVTSQYSDTGQLFPLVIGVPTFLMLVGLLAMQMSSRVEALASRYASSDLFDIEVMDEIEGEPSTGGGTERSLEAERLAVLEISLWTLAFFGVVVLIGFLPGTLVFLIAYYRLQADQSIPRTLLYSLLMWLFVIVIFEIVLGTPFYTGVLGVEVPLPLPE